MAVVVQTAEVNFEGKLAANVVDVLNYNRLDRMPSCFPC